MADESPSAAPQPRTLEGESLDRLTRLALEHPVDALSAIEALQHSVSDLEDQAMVHLLFFVAHASMPEVQFEALPESAPDATAICERALSHYRRALELSRRERTEEYQEEVVLRPASLFRKAQTAMATRTRSVTSYTIDFSSASKLLDTVCMCLEKQSPGRVHEILGTVKLKCLIGADRLYCQPNVHEALAAGILEPSDLAALGEFDIKSDSPDRPVRSIMMSGGYGSMVVAGYDQEERPSKASQCTSFLVFEKKQDMWTQTK